jgi:C-terminal processing protease CtpA/Prc
VCRQRRRHSVVTAAVLVSVLQGGAAAAQSRDYYPTAPGDRWVYESAVRGIFTNQVMDSTVAGGSTLIHMASTDAQRGRQILEIRHDGGRVWHRIGNGAEFVFADFTVPVGEAFIVVQGTAETEVTHIAYHDTLTVLGNTFRRVREYRHVGEGRPTFHTYFARDLGLVGMTWPELPQQTRLLRASVGGTTFLAEGTVPGTSGVGKRLLTEEQVANAGLLAQVWGFVKYHHPAVTGGSIDWDDALFDVLPALLEAEDRAGAIAVLNSWLAAVGEPDRCSACVSLDGDLYLEPQIGWIHDAAALGSELSGRLVRIHTNRSAGAAQQYVSLARNAYPDFSGEAAHLHMRPEDAGYRVLALFRYWNIIRYWFPYRDLIDDDWNDVLHEFIPIVMEADDTEAYLLALLRLVGRVHDTHATVSVAHTVRPPAGAAMLPVHIRFVEGHAVVTSYRQAELGAASGLEPGDVLLRMDGQPVDSMVAAWAPYYPASNQAARLRDMARALTRGTQGPVRLTVSRAGAIREVTSQRISSRYFDPRAGFTNDLPGETFRMLDDDVAYLKLSTVNAADLPEHFRRAADARVLVVDIRGYPNEFVVFPLAGRLVAEPTPFARFTTVDVRNPGAIRWRDPVVVSPVQPQFRGMVVVLVDETSQSQSEYTAMALRAGMNTIVVGSTTAGADGDVAPITLPGGARTHISGLGVFYPDRTPTQRIGIVPDLEVRPTIRGIREGRDEVLEAGVSRALGREWRVAH